MQDPRTAVNQPIAGVAGLPGEAPVVSTAVTRNRRASRRLLKAGGGLGLTVLGVFSLLAIGAEVGVVAFVTGLLLAAIPVPLYLALALRIDRFEPEPFAMLAWTFFWGASAATFLALLINTAGQAIVGAHFGSDVGEIYGSSISAPIVEESAKGAVLFVIYRRRRHEFNGVIDGLVYAAMVGLGFAMTENILYYGKAAVEGGVPLAATFFFRGVMAPFMHPLFTSLTGIGLGVAITASERWKRTLAPAAGLLGAMLLHSAWNTSAVTNDPGVFFGFYTQFMLPAFVVVLLVITVARGREGLIVRAYLQPEVAGGLLDADDIRVLSSIRERKRAMRAARAHGKAARRARRDFHNAASELAFHRWRLARGLGTYGHAPEDDERAFVERIRALRPQLPPAPKPPPGRPLKLLSGLPARTPIASATHGPAATPAQAAASHPPPPAGWYPDPWRHARLRWWDGQAWSGYTAP
jgi:protease PrsW